MEARSLQRTFPPHVAALRDVSFTVPEGQRLAIVGPSGSGKSTLLSILGLLDSPTSGSYSLGGVETSGLRDSARTQLRAKEIGFVFQAYHLVPHLTALENVELGLAFTFTVPRRDRRRRALALLEKVGLARQADQRAIVLSGGEQQRVAVARALVKEPRLLLCDEPTGNLDASSAAIVTDMVLHAGAACTTIVVTHNETLASRCDRILRVADGSVASDGSP